MRDRWSVELTIGLIFAVIIAVLTLLVVGVIGVTACAVMQPEPQQEIVQQVETTGDVKRLCIEAKTGEHVDAMSCQLIDPQSGGVK